MSYTSIKALFTAICNAIRAKDGTSALISHQDIPDRIAALGGGDDFMTIKQQNTETTYSNSDLTTLFPYAFAGWSALQTVDLPNVSDMWPSSLWFDQGIARPGNGATISSSLQRINTPKLEHLRAVFFDRIFNENNAGSSINYAGNYFPPNAYNIDNYGPFKAFKTNQGVWNFDVNMITSFHSYCLYGSLSRYFLGSEHIEITSENILSDTAIQFYDSSFGTDNNSNLGAISSFRLGMDHSTKRFILGYQMLKNQWNLKVVAIKGYMWYMYSGCFTGCSSLEVIDIYNVHLNNYNQMNQYQFDSDWWYNAANLRNHSMIALIIRNTSDNYTRIPKLPDSGGLNSFLAIRDSQGKTGKAPFKIYVPQSKIADYEADANWGQYAGIFEPIEGSIYESYDYLADYIPNYPTTGEPVIDYTQQES